MNFSRPATADPKKLLAAANEYEVTQSFASPAVWDKLSRHCEQTGEKVPTLKKVFSCGAPVPAKVLGRTLACVHPKAEMHTPYGATESLPVSTIEAKKVLDETAAKTDEGAGVCVGKKVDSIEWRVIRITDDPIATISETEELLTGEIGELIVRGPQVSREYLGEPEASAPGANHQPTHNTIAKIQDGETIWHRMGDVGYLDEQGRFWYCGRKSHRVVTAEGTLFTECVEQVNNTFDQVVRTALVGIGKPDKQTPTLIAEIADRKATLTKEWVEHWVEFMQLHEQTRPIKRFLVRENLPTDIRHNAKINREKLAKVGGEETKKREH